MILYGWLLLATAVAGDCRPFLLKTKSRGLQMKKLKFAAFIFVFFAVTLLCAAPTVSFAKDDGLLLFGKQAELAATTGDEMFFGSVDEIVSLSEYDPRNVLTPVRDQGDTNLCWAYSAINASEASIIKNKLATKDELKLNPEALAYRKYVRNVDPLGNNASYYKDADNWLQGAGHVGYTAALLSLWQGPVSGDKPAADVWTNSLYRLESANLISSGLTDDDRIAEIKRAIAEFGGVTASCNYNGGNSAYYNDKTVSGIAHAITLIGWNDGIDKDLFRPKSAERNGGWLVKNSYNDNAYFWLTYDSKIATTTAWTFTYAPKDAYDYNYFYDNNENDFPLFKQKRVANVYEAKKGENDKHEYIEAVNIGFTGNDVALNVKVYKNLSGWGQSSVESGVLVAEKTQTFKYGGYKTIKLDEPVKIDKGQYFSVVAEVSNPTNDAYVNVVQSESKKPSFYKTYDGYDFMANGGYVARVKAYTKLKDAEPDHVEHDYGNIIPQVDATCLQSGTRAHYYCLKCGKYFDVNKTETTLADLTIAANPDAHTFGQWVDEIPANCTRTGVKGHKDCSVCNKHFDASGNELVDLIIPKNDAHEWGAWVSNGDGTHTRVCKTDENHTETRNCFGGTATCTEKAVCNECKTPYGNTASHVFGEWVKEVPATATEFGVKGHKDCTVCRTHFYDKENEIVDLTIAKLDTCKVTVNDGDGGGVFEKGTQITVRAKEPEKGKVFSCWKDENGNVVGDKASYTFTVTKDITLSAEYKDEVSNGCSGASARFIDGSAVIAGLCAFAAVVVLIKRER